MVIADRALSKRFHEAVSLAIEVHGKDVRKGTDIPYISHLFSVCSLVLYDGGSENEAIAALLHDTLEDHPEMVTPGMLQEKFGKEVLSIIQNCSDTPKNYTGGPKAPWMERKKKYLEHLGRLFSDVADRDSSNDLQRKHAEQVLRVSMADKLDNVRSMVADYRRLGEEFWKRFNAGKDQQLWFLQSLLEVYTRGHEATGAGLHLLEEFQRSVAELEGLAKG